MTPDEEDEKSVSLFGRKEHGVLVYGGKKYAVGLTWLTTGTEDGPSLVKSRAQKLEADYYCVRSTIANQHGFGYINQGHKMHMSAAAAIAADALVGDWHGVFKADNGWWYIAVHSDNISPEGDLLFFSEEKAYSHFTEQAGLYSWPRSYAPETWNIEDANPEIPLNKLLEDVAAAPVLRPNNLDAIFGGRKRRNFMLFVSTLAVAFLFSAAILPAMISKAREQREVLARPVILAPAVIKPPPKASSVQASGFAGTLRLPRPSAVVLLCAQGFSRVIEPLPGWTLETATCNGSLGNNVSTEATWRRKVGSLEMVKQYLARFPSTVSLNFDGKGIITASFRHGNLSDISSNPKVLRRDDQIRILYDRFGDMGKLELSDVAPPAPAAPRGVNALVTETQAPQRPPYLKMTVQTKTPPDILASYFDVPGLKLQNITWSLRNKTWTYSADILFESPQFNIYYGVQADGQ